MADHVKDRMDRGLTDIGLLLEPINMDKYDFIRLKQKETWVMSMHPDAPLAVKDYVTAEDLVGVPLMMPHRLNVVFKSNLSANGSVMVYHRLAYALTVTGSIELWDKGKIVHRPLYPELTATSALAWKRHQPFGKAAEKFIEHIRGEFKNE